MSFDQIYIFCLLAASIGLFIWGRFRYDVVAVGVLMLGVLGSVIPAEEAFNGFGHPAVVTVIAILIISEALKLSGIIDYVGDFMIRFRMNATLQVLALTVTVGVLSAFMNNVGALALMLPVALQYSAKINRSPSELLMPLSFGSLLGGLATLIGTPPNIVIAGYRKDITGESFSMFDFLPVGGIVALVGALYIGFIGWRLLPNRRPKSDENNIAYAINNYLCEVRIPAGSELCEQPIRIIETSGKGDIAVVSLLRGQYRKITPPAFEIIHSGDVLTLEGSPHAILNIIEKCHLDVVTGQQTIHSDEVYELDIEIMESVITPGSRLENVAARKLRLNTQYGINLIAVARQGRAFLERIGKARLRAGDILLLQGERDNLNEAMTSMGCLPIAGQGSGRRLRRSPVPLLIFIASIVATASGILAPQIAFMCAVTLMVLFKYIGLRDLYDSIEWPVIVLLGAMIPLGNALTDTGGASLVADGIGMIGGGLPVWCLMLLLMVVTMLLSDVINNTATAVLMAPIASQLALSFNMNIDPFLMAVAVASSSTFLTPIGHQSNVLVMGPGGYKFGDYWRMGLMLDVLIITVAIPAILYFWPV